jgi:2-oxoglutarate ferredoxin oxidoreductase subunit delta
MGCVSWKKELNMVDSKNKKHEICSMRCKSCGLCVDICPKKVLAIGSSLNGSGYAVVEQQRPEDCVLCDICRIVCPDVAIGVVSLS